MQTHNLTLVEEQLIEKYQITKDEDIAIYFFNKMGKDILDIIYSKINLKFTSIPFEKEDLTCFVWKSLKMGLNLYKKDKQNFWANWIKGSYYASLKEIKKYFSNSELILNFANSWEVYSQTHCILKKARDMVEMPKERFEDILRPIVEYVAKHNRNYGIRDVKKLLYLKSFGYSEREMAEKMNVSRRYIRSMLKLVLKLSKVYLRTSNR